MTFLSQIRERAGEEGSWVRAPYVESAFDAHEEAEKDFDSQAVSKGDFATRAIWVTIDSFIVNPLMALAALVEGVFRTIAGLLALAVSLIPFEGNQDLRDAGKGLMKSSLQCGKVFGLSIWNFVKVPSVVVGKTVKVFWSTSCCSKEFEPPEVDENEGIDGEDDGELPSPVPEYQVDDGEGKYHHPWSQRG